MTSSNRKHGVPIGSLSEAEKIVAALWDIGRHGYVTQAVLAQKLGIVVGGTRWHKKLVLPKQFGLLDKESRSRDARIRASELAKRLLNNADAAAQKEARREAVHNVTAYRTLLDSFGEGPRPDQQALATILHFEYGLKGQDAVRAARSLRESVEYAGILDSATGSQVTRSDDPEGTEVLAAEHWEPDEPAFPQKSRTSPEDDSPETPPTTSPGPPPRPDHATGFTFQVDMDLSGYTAQDVITILRELRAMRWSG